MSKKATIKFSPKILARLGEELNQSPSQGLIELVKNAYDADAKECHIELEDVSKSGGTILISDSGQGMTVGDIEKKWLLLGSSEKKQTALTKLGRIPAGNKGLGRLAALRLGTKTYLTSIQPSNLKRENSVEIDWNLIDAANAVEDVELNIQGVKYSESRKPGSLIVLENLRKPLPANEVKNLARAMILLSDPFDDDPKAFRVKLKSKEFSELQSFVEKSYFSDCEYHVSAKVDSDGIASADVKDWKGRVLYSADHEDIRKKSSNKPFKCPAAKFEMWLFILDGATFSTRSSTMGEVKNWLSEVGGVHLYANGLRVSPYGDPGDDWLGINLSRVRSPELRPSTNTSIGKIIVEDSKNSLWQKTDRSGFVENESFSDLKSFAIETLDWLAKRRVEARDLKRRKERKEAKKKVSKTTRALDRAIENLPEENKKDIKQAISDREKEHSKQIESLEREVQLYRTLSTAGITSAVFAHESANNPIKLIAQSIKSIKTRSLKLNPNEYDKEFSKPISRVLSSVEALRTLATVTLSLISYDKRRAGQIDVHKVIADVGDLYAPFLKERKTSLEFDFAPGKPFLMGSIAAVESIFTNLINNSLVAFENSNPGARSILVRSVVNESEEFVEVRVMDNGPGIQGVSLKDIWLPGVTTNQNGTGLGMTIVRDAVSDLDGEVKAIEKGELGGAEVVITFPILGVD